MVENIVLYLDKNQAKCLLSYLRLQRWHLSLAKEKDQETREALKAVNEIIEKLESQILVG